MGNLKQAITVFLFLLPLTVSIEKCPNSCQCELDDQGRYYALCDQGNMKQVPVQEFDSQVEVIVIRGPKNTLTIGPIFQQFKKLQILRIIDSNIPAIGIHSFWGIKSLRILDLSKNNITQINVDNFKGQQNLLELNLSKNKLDRMPSSPFQYLIDLRVLNLADNSFGELVTRMFYMLSKLKILDLSDNPIDELIPDVFKDVQDLKVLRCRGCRLQNINPQLYNILRHLLELDLGNNQFKFLDKEEFNDLKYLKRIHLDGNQLTVVTDNLFQRQKSLEYLDLSRNRMAKISSKAFTSLSNLTFLDISYNKLSLLELDYMSHLTKLQTFNISGNVQMDLVEIRPIFQSLSQLQELSIADMKNMPLGLFIPLSNLQILNISGTRLNNETIQILNPLGKLKLLDLSRNQLTGFEEDMTEKLLKIDDIKWDQNPFVCDVCHMGAILNRLRAMKWKYMPECFLPEHLRGKPINRLVKDNLEFCYEKFIDEGHDAASTSHNYLDESGINILAFFGAAILVLLILIIIVTASLCTRQRAQYYTRENGKGDSAKEKCIDSQTISNEINFKFPLQDRVCTIDEMFLPPSPPIKSMLKESNN
ncbi:unnamed protein product [Diamesa serratosioi]